MQVNLPSTRVCVFPVRPLSVLHVHDESLQVFAQYLARVSCGSLPERFDYLLMPLDRPSVDLGIASRPLHRLSN